MLERNYLHGRNVALSVSESDDLAMMGFTPVHLADAFAELVRHVLADGGAILYGGDLRQEGYTELLFELIDRYRPDASEASPAFTSMLPWPVHMTISDEDLLVRRNGLSWGSRITCLGPDGEVVRTGNSGTFSTREPTGDNWKTGLRAMRDAITRQSNLRIVLGGRTKDYRGTMPGIAEEALCSFQSGTPLFLIGGFGGCAADICGALGYLDRNQAERWDGLEQFSPAQKLNNGLTPEENATLARTPHIDQVLALVLRGITRLFR